MGRMRLFNRSERLSQIADYQHECQPLRGLNGNRSRIEHLLKPQQRILLLTLPKYDNGLARQVSQS